MSKITDYKVFERAKSASGHCFIRIFGIAGAPDTQGTCSLRQSAVAVVYDGDKVLGGGWIGGIIKYER